MARGALGEDVEEAVAGGTWLFLSMLAMSLSGFLFWLVVAGLAGVGTVGVAGSIVSASGVAVTLASAGLMLAVAREVAARGPRALPAGLAAGILLGTLAAGLAWLLASRLSQGGPRGYASLLAFTSVASGAALASLLGLEEFRGYFASSLGGALAKLAIGAGLALAGYGLASALAGYLAAPLAVLGVSLALLAPRLRGPSLQGGGGGGVLRSVLGLTASNYPYILSSQLLTMLSIYAYALLSGEAFSTGVLYMAMMVALVLAAIPGSMLNAALPIATRRGGDPFAEAARLGLALTSPLVAVAIAAPGPLLALVNPGLSGGAWALVVLSSSVAPATILNASINKLNRDARKRELALMGLARLLVLLALIAPLARLEGIVGVALAYLAANAAPLPLALRYLEADPKPLLGLWAIQAGLPLALAQAHWSPWPTAALAAVLTLLAQHAASIAGLGEIVDTLQAALAAIRRP